MKMTITSQSPLLVKSPATPSDEDVKNVTFCTLHDLSAVTGVSVAEILTLVRKAAADKVNCYDNGAVQLPVARIVGEQTKPFNSAEDARNQRARDRFDEFIARGSYAAKRLFELRLLNEADRNSVYEHYRMSVLGLGGSQLDDAFFTLVENVICDKELDHEQSVLSHVRFVKIFRCMSERERRNIERFFGYERYEGELTCRFLEQKLFGLFGDNPRKLFNHILRNDVADASHTKSGTKSDDEPLYGTDDSA